MLPSTATFPLHAHFVPPLFKFIRFWAGPFHCRMIFSGLPLIVAAKGWQRREYTSVYTWDGPVRGMLCFSLHVWVIFSPCFVMHISLCWRSYETRHTRFSLFLYHWTWSFSFYHLDIPFALFFSCFSHLQGFWDRFPLCLVLMTFLNRDDRGRSYLCILILKTVSRQTWLDCHWRFFQGNLGDVS